MQICVESLWIFWAILTHIMQSTSLPSEIVWTETQIKLLILSSDMEVFFCRYLQNHLANVRRCWNVCRCWEGCSVSNAGRSTRRKSKMPPCRFPRQREGDRFSRRGKRRPRRRESWGYCRRKPTRSWGKFDSKRFSQDEKQRPRLEDCLAWEQHPRSQLRRLCHFLKQKYQCSKRCEEFFSRYWKALRYVFEKLPSEKIFISP